MGAGRTRRYWFSSRPGWWWLGLERLQPQEGRPKELNINKAQGAFQRFGRRVRKRLLWTFVAFGVGASLTWYFKAAIFGLLFAPANGSLSPYGGLPVFTGPSEMMGAAIHLVMMAGLVVALPVATTSVYQLVSPLLGRQQRRYVVLFLPAIVACFLCGAAFAYFVMLPVGLKFLLSFGEGIAYPLISIAQYMSLVTAMLFWIGMVFELPPVMFLLTKLRLVRYERFRGFRRYVPVTAFILSAIITPTFDVVNQTMVAVPIILLFEFGLFLSWLARPKEEGHKNIVQRVMAMVGTIWRWLLTVFMVPLRMARRGWAWFTDRLKERKL